MRWNRVELKQIERMDERIKSVRKRKRKPCPSVCASAAPWEWPTATSLTRQRQRRRWSGKDTERENCSDPLVRTAKARRLPATMEIEWQAAATDVIVQLISLTVLLPYFSGKTLKASQIINQRQHHITSLRIFLLVLGVWTID